MHRTSSKYTNRFPTVCVPSATAKRKTTKALQTQNNPQTISSAELDEFQTYYDIQNIELLASRNDKNIEENALNRCSFLSQTKIRTNSMNDLVMILPKKSIDSLKGPNTQVKMETYVQYHKPTFPIGNSTTFLEENKSEKKVSFKRMDWNNYHRLDVIHTFLEELEYEYPSLCTTGVIGKSLEGRDLKILRISNSNTSNSSVWIDAGIHAREWIAPAVNTFIANHIAKNFDSLSNSMRNKDWYFLPVVNPDGYEYTHTHNRMWRKNKAVIKQQLYGVDLNRNFSHGWGGKGSSDDPTHAFYRGPQPFSEPESSAIRNIFMNSGVSFQVYITLHSFGQVIIMPFAYSPSLAPDYVKLLQGATVMSRAIYNTNGNIYKVGVSKDVMYTASGTSNDWSHGVVGIPFCYLIELRNKKYKFKLPEADIAETGTEIVNSLTALMEFVDNYKSPEITNDFNTDVFLQSTNDTQTTESGEEKKE